MPGYHTSRKHDSKVNVNKFRYLHCSEESIFFESFFNQILNLKGFSILPFFDMSLCSYSSLYFVGLLKLLIFVDNG